MKDNKNEAAKEDRPTRQCTSPPDEGRQALRQRLLEKEYI